MADKDRKKVKYLSKSVKFAGKQVTLYSLDGATWSTRKEELHQILERQEAERVSFNQLLGEAKAKEGQEEETESAEAVDPVIEDEMLPIEDEPPAPVKAKVAAKAAVKTKSTKPAKKAAPLKKEKALATPKARISSKPASTNKAAAPKNKRKVA